MESSRCVAVAIHPLRRDHLVHKTLQPQSDEHELFPEMWGIQQHQEYAAGQCLDNHIDEGIVAVRQQGLDN